MRSLLPRSRWLTQPNYLAVVSVEQRCALRAHEEERGRGSEFLLGVENDVGSWLAS
jgi:hypothetical protein